MLLSRPTSSSTSLHLALEILPLDQVWYLVVIVSFFLVSTLLLLQTLVRLGQSPQRGERVRAQLVQDAGNELCEFFVLAVAVDSEGVRGNGSVDCFKRVGVNSYIRYFERWIGRGPKVQKKNGDGKWH